MIHSRTSRKRTPGTRKSVRLGVASYADILWEERRYLGGVSALLYGYGRLLNAVFVNLVPRVSLQVEISVPLTGGLRLPTLVGEMGSCRCPLVRIAEARSELV